ncbi:HpcH/HpaI aldolase/citrate lyase family protein [Nocardioides sp. TF02-7]|uniref:HpcH/HpaI aldolase/citrate lyase family protein n=1 Tax=Nocardioides sp. TF02-7 TaxID=2917724 RepID=UPI0023DABEE0|nr:HpcH/HpaI aldolase/citrate lyase family protein [Nocardioides sp. TF02-7]
MSRPTYAMPILETPEIAYVESRRAALADLAAVFDDHRESVLCVRIGGTDLSGLFGLRRDRDTTVWDIAVVRDALSDIVNQFARGGRYVVTGAVWEHIPGARLFKPQLRESPFLEQHAGSLRRRMIDDDVDALLREISLDRSNGLHGKTVIHPTHVSVVNSLLAVGWDEYDDACAIRDARGAGGAIASAHGRMNELGPHALWAEQVLARATAFGVVREGASLVELLALGQRAVAAEYGLAMSSVKVVS